MNAEIFTKSNCPYCDRAKVILDDRGISYQEIDAALHRDALIERVTRDTGKAPRTVPQIYLNEQYIGGHDDLVKYFKTVDQLDA